MVAIIVKPFFCRFPGLRPGLLLSSALFARFFNCYYGLSLRRCIYLFAENTTSTHTKMERADELRAMEDSYVSVKMNAGKPNENIKFGDAVLSENK